MTEIDKIEALRAALMVVLDNVDFTAGNCGPTEMISACLPTSAIRQARLALADTRP